MAGYRTRKLKHGYKFEALNPHEVFSYGKKLGKRVPKALKAIKDVYD